MADVKVSGLPSDSDLDNNHYIPVNDPTGPTTKRTLLSTLAAFLFNQINIPSGSGSPVTRSDELLPDVVISGLIWTGDSYGSTRNASMTTGIIYINGRRISISAVTARAFTASKDTYIDVLDNTDGTGSLVYTEVTNGAAAPSLAANSVRIGKIVTGASSIAAASSIVQSGLDSLSNLFYPQIFVKTTDANGWIKRAMGTYNIYTQRFTVSSQTINANSFYTVATPGLPIGIIDTGYVSMQYAINGGFLGRIVFGNDNGNSTTHETSPTFDAYNNSGSNITFSGFCHVTLITR